MVVSGVSAPPTLWVTEEDVKAGVSVDALLRRFGSAFPFPSPSLSLSFSAALSPLRVAACAVVDSVAPSRGWSAKQVSASLHCLFALHQRCHVQRRAGGVFASQLPSYATARLLLLRLLLAFSCPCPPFSSPVLHSDDCAALLALLDALYFPFLDLSQRAVQRSNRLALQSTSHRAQQPRLTTATGHLPLDAEGVTEEAVAEGEEQERPTAEKSSTPANAATAPSAADDSASQPLPPSSSAAVLSAVSDLQAQFRRKLDTIEKGPTADPALPLIH